MAVSVINFQRQVGVKASYKPAIWINVVTEKSNIPELLHVAAARTAIYLTFTHRFV